MPKIYKLSGAALSIDSFVFFVSFVVHSSRRVNNPGYWQEYEKSETRHDISMTAPYAAGRSTDGCLAKPVRRSVSPGRMSRIANALLSGAGPSTMPRNVT